MDVSCFFTCPSSFNTKAVTTFLSICLSTNLLVYLISRLKFCHRTEAVVDGFTLNFECDFLIPLIQMDIYTI